MDFHNDQPIEAHVEDLLNRRDLAAALARRLRVSRPEHALVVGVNGPWGAGKSSFLNLLRSEIQRQQNKAGEPEIEYRIFAPWYFRDIEALMHQFNLFLHPRRARMEHLLQRMLVGAQIIGVVLALIGIGFGLYFILTEASSVSDLMRFLSVVIALAVFFGALMTRKSPPAALAEAFNEPRDTLRILEIDDIDRWEKDSVIHLLKLVRMSKELHNTIFVLAFNREIVAGYLEQDNVSGDEYLEKIIQINIDLPAADASTMDRYLRSKLEGDLQSMNVRYRREDVRFERLFAEIFPSVLTNIRSVKRYRNGLSFTYPPVVNEVNVSDFLAVELLRVEFPTVYARIPQLKARLVRGDRRDSRDELSPSHRTSLIKDVDEDAQETVWQLLNFLFPTRVDWEGDAGEERETSGYIRALGVDDPTFFDRYFQLAIPQSQVADADIERFLSASDPTDELARLFPEEDDVARRTFFIDRLGTLAARRGDRYLEVYPSLCTVFAPYLEIHTRLSLQDTVAKDSKSRHKNAAEIQDHLALQNVRVLLQQGKRAADFARGVVEQTPFLHVAVRFVYELEVQQENITRFEQREEIWTQSHRALMERIQKSYDDDTLWDLPAWPYILDAWRRWDPAAFDAANIGQRAQDTTTLIQMTQKLCHGENRVQHRADNSVWRSYFAHDLLEALFGSTDALIERLSPVVEDGSQRESARAQALIRMLRDSMPAQLWDMRHGDAT